MSARANLVINDRAATPVAHTYTPDGDRDGVHIFRRRLRSLREIPLTRSNLHRRVVRVDIIERQ